MYKRQEYNPSSGYDGRSPASTDWSMVRFMTGDCYPFLESVRFGIESGEDNRANYLEHSGAVLYYGQDLSLIHICHTMGAGNTRSQ